VAGLEPIALVALCGLGILFLLIAAPVLLPLLGNVLGFAVDLLGAFLELLVGGPTKCCCSCLLFLMLGVAAAAIGLVLIDNACTVANPPDFCSLLGH
jgi:hypothetical protein